MTKEKFATFGEALEYYQTSRCEYVVVARDGSSTRLASNSAASQGVPECDRAQAIIWPRSEGGYWGEEF
jgi:hypothetical protein